MKNREHYAGLAMIGLIIRREQRGPLPRVVHLSEEPSAIQEIAKEAVEYADAICKELDIHPYSDLVHQADAFVETSSSSSTSSWE